FSRSCRKNPSSIPTQRQTTVWHHGMACHAALSGPARCWLQRLTRMADHNQHALFDLRGQVALVTGSTRGLGYEIARGLGQAGATVIVHGRDESSAQAASCKLSAEGLTTSWVAFDLDDRIGRHRAFEQIKSVHQRLDILVNNASIRMRRRLQDIDAMELETITRTN